jgi:hypothetical protein
MRQLSNKDISTFATVMWLASIMSAPAVLLIYWVVGRSSFSPIFPNITDSSIDLLLGVIATFSITMTGFIAAIGAYLLSVSSSPSFNLWRNAGYLKLFYHLYAAAITFLLLTFSFCVLALLLGKVFIFLKITLALLLVNFAHIALITISAINQTNNSTRN